MTQFLAIFSYGYLWKAAGEYNLNFPSPRRPPPASGGRENLVQGREFKKKGKIRKKGRKKGKKSEKKGRKILKEEETQ